MSAVLETREPNARYLAALEPSLVQHFDLFATALGGVARLRELILTMAVQGKLAQQDPSDEPASNLLKRIQSKRDQLVAQGYIKRTKSEASSEVRSPPFDAPTGWEWVCASDVCVVITDGDHQAPPKADSGVPFLVIGDVRDGSVALDSATRLVSKEYFEGLDWAKKPLLGDVLYTTVGSLGIPVPIVRQESFCFQRHIALFRPGLTELQGFLTLALRSRLAFDQAERGATGIAQKTVPLSVLRNLQLPLPPLADQHRIVARVEELMKLCDTLEQSGRLADEQHTRLTSTLFDALAASESAHALPKNWQRVAEHFDLLLDRPEAIDALEQTIFTLAVRGLLSPQLLKDEHAASLRQQIHDERTRLFASGAAKREQPLKPVQEDEYAFPLPSNWVWVRFDELVKADKPIAYGVLVPGPDTPGGVPFVRLGDLSLESPPVLPEKSISTTIDAQFARTRLDGGELLLGVVGSIGKLGVAPVTWKGANIARAICRIVPTPLVDHTYVLILLQSQFMRERFSGDTRTLAQPTLNIGLIRACPTPLPPLKEQHRIVARIEELRRLCADLRLRLTQAREVQSRLADALVSEVA